MPSDSLLPPTIDPADRPVLGQDVGRGNASQRRPLVVRLLPMLIVVVALGGFAGIVGYYYLAGSGGSDGVVPLVKAEDRPLKVRPDNPGGMEVPDQDKEIYNRLGQAERQRAPTGERLLPPPETPLPRPPAAPVAPAAPAQVGQTPFGMAAPNQPQTLSAAPPRPAGAPPPQVANIPPAPDVAPPPASAVTSQTTISPPAPNAPAQPLPRPAPVAAAPTPVPPAPPAQVAAAAPRPAVAGGPGTVRVAIASVKSETDARKEWERQKRLYPAALSRVSADFASTDLGERGVYWRIYVGPSESNPDAQARCSALKQQQVSCFVARP